MSRVAGVLLAPGAGSDREAPSLLAVERAVAPVPVERMDFPYRRAGRRMPDRAPTLVAAVVTEAGALAERLGVAPASLALGGRSMGGRMCSMAVADGLPAAALVLLAYPLHPPERPDRRRVEHLGRLDLPCLFVSGTRDAFATPAELAEAVGAVPGPVTLHWVEGARHELRGADDEVAEVVASWLVALDRGPTGSGVRRPRG